MSVPKSALHCTQIFNVTNIEFFGKFGTGVFMWGKGEEKSQQGREHRSWYFPSLHFSLNISSPLRPLSHQAFLGVMGKKEDHTGKSGGVSSSLSSISSLLWPLSQAFLEGKGEERTEQERQWQVNPLLSPHLHKISSLLLMSSQYRIT